MLRTIATINSIVRTARTAQNIAKDLKKTKRIKQQTITPVEASPEHDIYHHAQELSDFSKELTKRWDELERITHEPKMHIKIQELRRLYGD